MRFLPVFAALVCLTACDYGGRRRLWPGSRYTVAERDAAIYRALGYMDRIAWDPDHLSESVCDLLFCFSTAARTSEDEKLRSTALAMGVTHAKRWRASHIHVSPNASADEICGLVAATYIADTLGVHDDRLAGELREAVKRHKPAEYLGFDLNVGPPTNDEITRYGYWTDALTTSYFGEAAGIRLGWSFPEVVRAFIRLRPYPTTGEEAAHLFYTVTHVVYTLNDYNVRRVNPRLLAPEFAIIRSGLVEAIATADGETIGESLDTMKAFGFANDPMVRKGIERLIATQRPDGTWADADDTFYTKYHSAWTGIDGLRDYAYVGEVTKLP